MRWSALAVGELVAVAVAWSVGASWRSPRASEGARPLPDEIAREAESLAESIGCDPSRLPEIDDRIVAHRAISSAERQRRERIVAQRTAAFVGEGAFLGLSDPTLYRRKVLEARIEQLVGACAPDRRVVTIDCEAEGDCAALLDGPFAPEVAMLTLAGEGLLAESFRCATAFADWRASYGASTESAAARSRCQLPVLTRWGPVNPHRATHPPDCSRLEPLACRAARTAALRAERTRAGRIQDRLDALAVEWGCDAP